MSTCTLGDAALRALSAKGAAAVDVPGFGSARLSLPPLTRPLRLLDVKHVDGKAGEGEPTPVEADRDDGGDEGADSDDGMPAGLRRMMMGGRSPTGRTSSA